jgi:hypothetical protein
MLRIARVFAAVLAVCALFACASLDAHCQEDAPDAPEANPGRPTVSTPATLTPVGYLQFENGTLYGEESQEFDTRFSIVQVTKLTVLPRLQVIAQSEPLVASRDGTVRGHRPGEVFLGLQGVVLPGKGHRPTISASYIRRLYESPAPELDLGTFRQGAIILLSDDFFGFHFDVNGLVNEQAQVHPRRAQFAQTLSVSHPLGKATISGEIWHFAQPLTGGNAVGNLWAASYPVKKYLVVDAGFQHGLTSTSTQWEGFLGFTYLLPHRLWHGGANH